MESTYLEKRIKIDGLVLVGEDLDFANEGCGLNIPYPLSVKSQVPERAYKGVEMLKCRGNVFAIRLGWINNLDINVVLKGDNIIFYPYTEILDHIEVAIEYAFADILHTTSGQIYAGSLQAIERYPGTRRIQMGDLRKWGKCFKKRIMVELEDTMFTSMCFLAEGFGQNVDWEEYLNPLKVWGFSHCTEIVVHVAMDVEKPNHSLFWSRNKAAHIEGTIFAEYYPLLLKGSGNFYINRRTEQMPKIPCIKEIKLYNSAFKHLHREQIVPFSKPKFADMLWKSMKQKRPYNKTQSKELSEAILELELEKRNIEMLKTSTGLSARMEYVVSICSPMENCVRESVDWVLNDIENGKFYRCSMFEMLNSSELNTQIENYMEPPLLTIQAEIEQLINSLVAETFYTLTIEKYLTIKACEAILSFGNYGISISTRVKLRHNTVLCRYLGLTARGHERAESEDMVYRNLSVYEDGRMKLWVRDPNLITTILVGMKVGDLNIARFLKKLQVAVVSGNYQDVVSEYLKFVLMTGATEGGCLYFDIEIPCRESRKVKREDLKLVSSKEFLERVLWKKPQSNEYAKHEILYTDVIIKSCLNDENYKIWTLQVEEGLDEQMWLEKCEAIFPLSSSTCIIALPLAKFCRVEHLRIEHFNIFERVVKNYYKCITNLDKFKGKMMKTFELVKEGHSDRLGDLKIWALMDFVIKWTLTDTPPGRITTLFRKGAWRRRGTRQTKVDL